MAGQGVAEGVGHLLPVGKLLPRQRGAVRRARGSEPCLETVILLRQVTSLLVYYESGGDPQ
eukprot:scaffold677706_cov42-Prasinocladus_malaysianus.AAC.1